MRGRWGTGNNNWDVEESLERRIGGNHSNNQPHSIYF